MSAYQAVVALGSVDSLHTLNADQVCASVIPVVTNDMQLETAYHATHILSRLRFASKLTSASRLSGNGWHLLVCTAAFAAELRLFAGVSTRKQAQLLHQLPCST